MLYLISACLLLAGAAAADSNLLDTAQVNPQGAFAAWLQTNGKHYGLDYSEYSTRFMVFQANVAFIRQHNAENPENQLALNEYADMTWEEFSRQKLGFKADSRQHQQQQSSSFRYSDVDPPATVDWREKNVVTEVKNQGACGSCWAFSATGSIEGINAIKTGELVTLSEQELVDCDGTTGNAGCGGGLMDWAFEYVKKNGGIDTEEDYSYWSGWGFGTWCNQRKLHDRTVVTIDGYEDVPKDETALKKAVSQQPVSVAICADSTLQFYSGGVVSKCCTDLNHGVLAVGYGTTAKGEDYWLIKNSWGAAWGDSGYFKLGRGVGGKGMCGVLEAASYPIKTHPNPKVPVMCDMFGWQECPSGNTCSCSWPFFFNLFCIRHDCCPLANAASCPDNQHCCPGDYPNCDTQRGLCLSEDGTKSVPWTGKSAATLTAQRRAGDEMASVRGGLKRRDHDQPQSQMVQS